jgi:hypothetical protein
MQNNVFERKKEKKGGGGRKNIFVILTIDVTL